MKRNSLEYSVYFLAHNLGMSIDEVKLMEVERFRKWMEYFHATNSTGEEEQNDDNNVAGFLQHLKGI